jgi:hypothetical protein
VHGTMSVEVLEQQYEGMLREAELNRLKKKALRAGRKRLGTSRWASAVAWELARTLGTLRKFFKAPKNAD